jgi:hypothetical protein
MLFKTRYLSPEMEELLIESVHAIPLDSGGGSGSLKALILADLIIEHHVSTTVEIGVYRGRSLLPIALLFRTIGSGTAIGIDPWQVEAALQFDDHEIGPAVNDWTRIQPWDATYESVIGRIRDWDLDRYCQLLRMKSGDAASLIHDHSVGLVHIDGNHDQAQVQRDVELYAPKLVPGGFLVLDDPSWHSVRPIADKLRETYEAIFEINDFGPMVEDQQNDFAVYRLPA